MGRRGVHPALDGVGPYERRTTARQAARRGSRALGLHEGAGRVVDDRPGLPDGLYIRPRRQPGRRPVADSGPDADSGDATATVAALGLPTRTLASPPTITDADAVVVDHVVPAAACGALRNPDGTFLERVPEKVVIHVLDNNARYAGNISNWSAGSDCTPPHYVIRDDGEITQMVSEKFMAQHAGPGGNPTMIGIEHDGWDNDPDNFTEAMYRSSAALVTSICGRNPIPVDRGHIIGHDEVPGRRTATPAATGTGTTTWRSCGGTRRPARSRSASSSTRRDRLRRPRARPWHALDRDSANATWAYQRTHMGPLFFSGYGLQYLWAQGDPHADDNDAVEYMFVAPEAGVWDVSGWWPLLQGANTATRIQIAATGVDPIDLVVDQSAHWRRTRPTLALEQTPTWSRSPALTLAANDVVTVRVQRRSDDTGKVVADAFRFLKTD